MCPNLPGPNNGLVGRVRRDVTNVTDLDVGEHLSSTAVGALSLTHDSLTPNLWLNKLHISSYPKLQPSQASRHPGPLVLAARTKLWNSESGEEYSQSVPWKLISLQQS